MKILYLDLRDIDTAGGETWADCPARTEIENALLDFAGKIIRVVITKQVKPKLDKAMSRYSRMR